MKKRNVILISLDEVRPDHLSCYGYDKIKTPNIDKIAQRGVLYENAIAAGCFTAICMSSTICGAYPNKTTFRDPYSHIQFKTVTQTLKEYGFKTAGFVGNGVLGSRHGFAAGFDVFDEPTKETSDNTWQPDESKDEIFYGGNYWVDRMFDWLKDNHSNPFFIWGHYYHTHRGGEVQLLEKGEINKDDPAEFFYADTKIVNADERIIGGLLETLEKLKILDDTIIVVMSDHGTNFGEHPARPFNYVIYPDDPEKDAKARRELYPQHLNLFDVNTRVVLVMMGKDLPAGVRINDQVRTVDIVPTLLELCQVSADNLDYDGESLISMINGQSQERSAYSENLQEWESEDGALTQCIRTNEFKFIRNLADTTEQYYDLKLDPDELNNIIDHIRETKKEELMALRKQMNNKLLQVGATGKASNFTSEEKEEINNRLRALGYMS